MPTTTNNANVGSRARGTTPKKPCHFGATCRDVASGKCRFGHPHKGTFQPKGPKPCRFGAGCRDIASGKCRFVHPAKQQQQLVKSSRPAKTKGGVTASIRVDDGNGHRESLSVAVTRSKLCFSGAVDVSWSMEGERIEAAIAGLGKVVAMMEDTDLFGLFTFGDSAKNLHHAMPRGNVDWAKDQRHILSNVGGCTALYDAIGGGVAEMKETLARHRAKGRADKLVFQQLVITDGADNSSTTSLAAIKALVAKPGLPDFHLVLIAVGIDANDARQMRSICDNNHSSFILAGDVRELGKVLQDQATRIKLVLDVDSHGRRSRTEATARPSTLGKTVRDLHRTTGSTLVAHGMKAISGAFRGLSITHR